VAIKGAIVKMLKKFDKKIASKPFSPPKPNIAPEAESVLVEVSPRSSNGTKNMAFASSSSSAKTSSVAVPIIHSEKRLALVIGNGHYRNVSPLDNSLNDAKDIAELLKQLGFEVSLYEDQTKQGMEQAVNRFGDKLKTAGGNTAALFYYAGHATEIQGINYLAPIEGKFQSENEADNEMVAVQSLVKQIESSGSSVNLVFLDACRDNPYPRKTRSFAAKSNHLATMATPSGTLVAYSTASGKQASDGDGHNGLYTGELLKNMRIPHLKIEDVLKKVSMGIKKSGNVQVPGFYSSLEGDFYFIPPK
jgi:uncharacterized caspase-like protein